MLYGWHAGEWSKPFSLSITPFTLKMLTKHTKLVELHLDDIRRVVLLNISLFPIAMSACGLRKPQLKATRQSYNAHWQPWDQPVLNWTVCYSACNSFQVTITHPQVDFSLFQSKQKRNMAAEGSFTQKSPAVSCSFVGPPKEMVVFPRRYRWVLQGAGLHVIRVELLHDGFQRRHPGFHQVAVGQEHPATTALRCFDEFHGLRERNGKEQGWGLWRNEKTGFMEPTKAEERQSVKHTS